jgi:anti-anti-sigma regulatory factor
MASNFEISAYPYNDTLCLKLKGDFDGTSAYELINELEKNCDGIPEVFIHTSALTHLSPMGRAAFHIYLDNLYKQPTRLVFTGKFSAQLAPDLNKARLST